MRRPGTGTWYLVVVWLSFGTLAWIPALHAAVALRRRSRWVEVAAFALLQCLQVVLNHVVDLRAAWWVAVAVLVLGLVRAGSWRHQVYTGSWVAPAPPPDPNARAVAVAHQARLTRDHVRALTAGDPRTARELGVGRPDLGRPFWDGGLVDLGTAPAAVVAGVCAVPESVAEQLVAVRQQLGGFDSVLDAVTHLDLDRDSEAALREHGIVLRQG